MRLSFLLILLSVSGWAQQAPQNEIQINNRSTIGLRPATLSFNLDAGQDSVCTIYIVNKKKDTYNFRISLRDWDRDTVGKKIYYPVTANYKYSCAGWISLDTNYISVKPGETKGVKIRLKIPADPAAVAHMRWTMLVFEVIKNTPKDKAAPINISTGLGTLIYQTPPNANFEKKLAVTDIVSVSNKKIRVSVGNIGDLQVRCKASLELRSTKGTLIKVDDIEAPMFPNQLRYFDFTLPADLLSGKYKVKATIYADYDEKSAETIERTIEIE